LDNQREVVIRQRRIAPELFLKAIGVTVASGLVVIGMTLLLGLGPTAGGDETVAGSFSFLEKFFTCMSAFCTVGLDVGVTSELNRWGQLVLIVGMFVGRLGILLLLSALYGRSHPKRVSYPEEDVYL
jgi:Trk-type K+ transport system membrane component